METFTIEKISFDKNKLYYSTSEVAELLQVTESTLRYWEKEFPFIEPNKSKKGTRKYTKKEITNIQLVVYLLKERKLTIQGAQKVLREDKNIEKKHAIVQKLKHIKCEIESLREAFDEHLNIKENGVVAPDTD